MLNFDFWWKGLEVAFPPHFVYEFSRKTILMLYSFNWPDFIVWLALLLDVLASLQRHNFEINLSFLIKLFFYITKKLVQKCKYVKKE